MSLDRRQFLTQGTALALGSVLGSVPSVSSSADNMPITRIEEDWEIKVANPNPDFNTPEIITSLGPLPDDLEPVGYLLINHETQPAYTAGEFNCRYGRIAAWSGMPIMATLDASPP